MLALGAVVTVGLLVRVDDLVHWRKRPELSFHDGIPSLTTFDGYHYLRYARDQLQGRYTRRDSLRLFPDGAPRSVPPPLLAVTAAAVTRVSGVRLEWVAVVLPALLGVGAAFPLYALGRRLGGRSIGLSAAAFLVLFPYYLRRTSVGRFDTDCGQVIFILWAVLSGWTFHQSRGWKKVASAMGCVINAVAFLLWWDTAAHVVFLVILASIVVPVVTTLDRWKETVPSAVGLVLIIALAFLGIRPDLTPGRLVERVRGDFVYVTKADAGAFPSVGVSVSEQQRLGPMELLREAFGHPLVGAAALLGLAALMWRNLPGFVLLLPILALAVPAFWAKRFAVFLTPLGALGCAFFFVAWAERLGSGSRRPWLAIVPVGLLAVALGFLTNQAVARTYYPVVPGPVCSAMERVGTETPAGAVIWTWWDHAYPLMYWAERATVSDGMDHGGFRSVVSAVPLVSQDYRLAANWMVFSVVRGPQGFRRVLARLGDIKGWSVIKKIMALGPTGARSILEKQRLEPVDEWLRFFFPPQSQRPPLYLYLDQRMIRTSFWWSWFGTWDVAGKHGRHLKAQLLDLVDRQGRAVYFSHGRWADLETGVFRSPTGDENILLSKAYHWAHGRWVERDFGRDGPVLELDTERRWALLAEPMFFGTLFNRLVVLAAADVRHFEPVLLEEPVFQLWRVKGDLPDNRPGS